MERGCPLAQRSQHSPPFRGPGAAGEVMKSQDRAEHYGFSAKRGGGGMSGGGDAGAEAVCQAQAQKG